MISSQHRPKKLVNNEECLDNNILYDFLEQYQLPKVDIFYLLLQRFLRHILFEIPNNKKES